MQKRSARLDGVTNYSPALKAWLAGLLAGLYGLCCVEAEQRLALEQQAQERAALDLQQQRRDLETAKDRQKLDVRAGRGAVRLLRGRP